MVEHKDVILGLLGASAALGGLVLVFLGFAVTTIQSYDTETPRNVVRGYKLLASAVGVGFLFAIVTAALCAFWLIGGHARALYDLSIVAFFVQLALLALAGIWALVVFIWRG